MEDTRDYVSELRAKCGDSERGQKLFDSCFDNKHKPKQSEAKEALENLGFMEEVVAGAKKVGGEAKATASGLAARLGGFLNRSFHPTE